MICTNDDAVYWRASLGLNELTWLMLQISNRRITPYFVHQFRWMLNLLCRKRYTNFINPEYFNFIILSDYIIKVYNTYSHLHSFEMNLRILFELSKEQQTGLQYLSPLFCCQFKASVAPLFILCGASRDVQGNMFLVISLESEGCYNSCYSRWDTVLVRSSFLIVVLVAAVCNI